MHCVTERRLVHIRGDIPCKARKGGIMFITTRVLVALKNTKIDDGRQGEARLLLSAIKHLRLIGEGSMVQHFFFPYGHALFVGDVAGQNYYILLGKKNEVEYVAQITTEMP